MIYASSAASRHAFKIGTNTLPMRGTGIVFPRATSQSCLDNDAKLSTLIPAQRAFSFKVMNLPRGPRTSNIRAEGNNHREALFVRRQGTHSIDISEKRRHGSLETSQTPITGADVRPFSSSICRKLRTRSSKLMRCLNTTINHCLKLNTHFYVLKGFKTFKHNSNRNAWSITSAHPLELQPCQ